MPMPNRVPVRKRSDDPFHDGPETVADQVDIVRDPEELLNGPEIEQRTVDGVVGLGSAVRGEEVGEETLPLVPADFGQDLDPFPDAAGAEGEAGEGDQGVPAPAPEPGVAGDDRRSPRRGRDEKLTSRAEQGEEEVPVFTCESIGHVFRRPRALRRRRDNFGLPERRPGFVIPLQASPRRRRQRITVHPLSTGTSMIPGRKRSSSQSKPRSRSSVYSKRLYQRGEGMKRDDAGRSG